MKMERPNAIPPSPEDLKNLDKLRAIIERAIADGKLTRQEMESIQFEMRADGKVTVHELELCRKLIWQKIRTGELEHDYTW
ncbi:MAG TPA: hypothetical protein V6C85_32645 [Allocoleopsis sp.]